MDSFTGWLKKKIKENSDYAFDSSEDAAGDYEVAFDDLTKTAMTKYPQDFLRFMTQLADERGDSELQALLKKVQGGSPTSWKPKHQPEPDEIVAPKADRGHEENSSD